MAISDFARRFLLERNKVHSASIAFAVAAGLIGQAAVGQQARAAPGPRHELGRLETVRLAKMAFDEKFSFRRHPPYSFEPSATEPDSRFYSYEAHGNWGKIGSPGSAVLGHLAVNRFTAEVWDEDSCKKIEFAALQRLQARYLRQLGVKAREHDAGTLLNRKPNIC